MVNCAKNVFLRSDGAGDANEELRTIKGKTKTKTLRRNAGAMLTDALRFLRLNFMRCGLYEKYSNKKVERHNQIELLIFVLLLMYKATGISSRAKITFDVRL
jgi:hypothetical protein